MHLLCGLILMELGPLTEPLFLKFALGSLLFVVLLGLISWLVMIAYNLDVLRSAIALGIVATASSLLGKLQMKRIKLGKK